MEKKFQNIHKKNGIKMRHGTIAWKLFVQSLNKKALNLRVIHKRLRNFCLVSLNSIEI